jgi:opacity protein-like surface antigen
VGNSPPSFFTFSNILGLTVKKLLLTSAMLAAALSAAAPAQAEGGDRLLIGAGYYDIMDNEDAFDMRAEWRGGDDFAWGIAPFVGAEATSDGALYGLAGLYRDFAIAPQWYITPSFGAGLYHDGDGKDLGHTVEFRSQIELGYEFESMHRMSVGFGHISNASLGDRNPGTEILNLYYHMPWN